MNLPEAYQDQLRRFFGEFLHEIKTPLTIMRTHMEAEITNESLPVSVRKKLVQDVEEIARINALLGDMRLLLGLDNAVRQRAFETASLLEVVMDVIERLEPIASAKRQKIALICSVNCTLAMDRHKIKQLFYNLIDNAIKYSEPDKEIEVVIVAEPLCVEVRDRGIGIPAEAHAHIFEPFYRAERTGRDGTGLGLAVADAIALMHNGKIELEARPEGGSVFRVRFA